MLASASFAQSDMCRQLTRIVHSHLLHLLHESHGRRFMRRAFDVPNAYRPDRSLAVSLCRAGVAVSPDPHPEPKRSSSED